MPPWVIIVLINLLLLVLGMFLDPTSILVIIVPIFFKTVTALGYDPVWFGVMVTIQIEIAAITPPVGFNLFVLKSVVPGVEMADVVRGSLIFIVPLLLGIAHADDLSADRAVSAVADEVGEDDAGLGGARAGRPATC